MTPAAILILLQAVASLLSAAQGPRATPATMQQAINFAGNSLQIIAQAEAPINFTVIPNNGKYPNIQDLVNAPYIDATGKYEPLGPQLQLVPAATSFGDLNNDGLDDAVVVVNKIGSDGSANYFLAAMLNQGGVLFNIADLPLSSSVINASHTIQNNELTFGTAHYKMLGTALVSVN